MPSSPAIELHLRLRVAQGCRADFLDFLGVAIPFYEAPGGIRVRLLENEADHHLFIEVIEYASRSDYERDQERVANDAQMIEYLARWRGFLAEPPTVEIYRMLIPDAEKKQT